ncbi:hypothetical protein TRVL_00660 [Trypanosoma vivax]|nr:hypothetical protein TRVL_00660 [Trypanosoma vivax]
MWRAGMVSFAMPHLSSVATAFSSFVSGSARAPEASCALVKQNRCISMGSTQPAARIEAQSTLLRCPECGKRFISAINMRQHRRSRHLVPIRSSSQEYLEQLREENAKLRLELEDVQKANSSMRSSSQASPSRKGSVAGSIHVDQSALPAAVPDSKVIGISASELKKLRSHPFRLGTGSSELRLVGVVEKDVELGHLEGGSAPGTEVLQFTLCTGGYRQQRNGRLMMYRNRVTVRLAGPQHRVEAGDVVLVTGTYGLHRSFDLISKQAVENAVIEAGFIGLIKKQEEEAQYNSEEMGGRNQHIMKF